MAISQKEKKEMGRYSAFFTTPRDEEKVRLAQVKVAFTDFGGRKRSIEAAIPEALEALPESSRPHPLALRGVAFYEGSVLLPYEFKWIVVPPYAMTDDDLVKLRPTIEKVADGTITLPDPSKVPVADRGYYSRLAAERHQQRLDDAKQVVLTTSKWTGWNSRSVVRVATRKEAVKAALAELKKIRLAKGGVASFKLLGVWVLYDDGQKLLIQIRSGYDYVGWRIDDTYIYLDPKAKQAVDWDNRNHEEYEIHALSLKKGDLFKLPR